MRRIAEFTPRGYYKSYRRSVTKVTVKRDMRRGLNGGCGSQIAECGMAVAVFPHSAFDAECGMAVYPHSAFFFYFSVDSQRSDILD
jgi:hypothetical protein